MIDLTVPRPSVYYSADDHEEAILELQIALEVLRRQSRRQIAVLNATLKRLDQLQREYETFVRRSTQGRGPAIG